MKKKVTVEKNQWNKRQFFFFQESNKTDKPWPRITEAKTMEKSQIINIRNKAGDSYYWRTFLSFDFWPKICSPLLWWVDQCWCCWIPFCSWRFFVSSDVEFSSYHFDFLPLLSVQFHCASQNKHLHVRYVDIH